jgi:hypothetical protein
MTAMVDSTEAMPLSRRLVNVMRVHTANPWPTLITPWLIFAGIFGANLAIWYAITVAAGGRDKLDPNAFVNNGGSWWILVFLMVVAVQAMSVTFRFALGMGFTRRDYYVGTVVYYTLLAVMFATGITVMAIVENATDGWGVKGRFFSPWWGDGFPVFEIWYMIATIALLFIFVGIAAATMWVRWAAIGLYVFFGSVLVGVVGAVWAITWASAWGSVGDFFTGHSVVTLVSMTLPITAACIALGYVFMRRATPRQ